MRRPQTRLLAAVALAALATGGLSACATLTQQTFEDDAEVPEKISSIRLDSENGSVKVDASAKVSKASVHREVSYRGDKPSGTSFRVENGVLTLSGCGEDCGVDYVVKVPAGLPVTGGTTNGGLTLTDVGRVDVHTSNGEIAVNKAAGPVKLRTTNGGVTVKDAKGGDIDTQTSNGEVTIRPTAPQNVRARTTNGSLTVTAPPASYRISADNSNGDKKMGLKNDPSGEYRLELSTTNGDLTVERAG